MFVSVNDHLFRNNRAMEYGWHQNKEIVQEEQLVDPQMSI